MKKSDKAVILRGYLGGVSGTLANLIVTKKGVCYIKDYKKKDKPKKRLGY